MMFNIALTVYLLGVLFVLWNLYEALRDHYDEARYMNKTALTFTILIIASCSWLIVLYCLLKKKGEEDE